MDQTRLRIVTYNIRKALGLDGRRDPGRILDILNALDADIIALQEADRRLGQRPTVLDRRLIERASDYVVAELAENEVSLGWHGNALLVHRDLTVLGTERLALPGLEPRGAVLAEIGTDARRITVAGAHLALLRPWRRRQAQVLADRLDIATTPTVAMGDFNEWSDVAGLEPLSKGYQIISPGRSFHAARPIAALDRFALGPEADLQEAGVDRSQRAQLASDHLPVWIDVTV